MVRTILNPLICSDRCFNRRIRILIVGRSLRLRLNLRFRISVRIRVCVRIRLRHTLHMCLVRSLRKRRIIGRAIMIRLS